MATAATIAAVTSIVGATAAAVQAVSQAKQAFLDPVKVALLQNVEEIHGALSEAVRVLGCVRKEFDIVVEKNKMRVPSRKYMEWMRRALEIDSHANDLIDEYNKHSKEGTSLWFSLPCPDFKEEMKKMHAKVFNLLRESNEIREKMLVDRSHAPEAVMKRNGPDIRKFEKLRKPLEKILDLLKRYNVKGIGIYGPVGIGKTTIMLNLNNNDQVAKMFDIVIWLTVSKEGGKENLRRDQLQHAIAQRLKLPMVGTSTADEVTQRIYTELKGKKYLLLLDDVKIFPNLEEIGIPYSNNGSKIVLTTRLRHVCEDQMVDKEIKVEYLSSGDAWKMFQDVLGSKKLIEDGRIGPLASRVCRECGGVPLVIEKVANTFKLKNTESLWWDGLNSWRMWPSRECEGIREMFELFRFFFNDLGDDRYKKCFLYGALYPEESDIDINSLLERWAAEDLLGYGNDPRKVPVLCGYGNDLRKVSLMTGDLILAHLKNVSLLEECESEYQVTMHKFIRQVALFISEDHPDMKNRISLLDHKLDRLPDFPNCTMLSTLFLQKNLHLREIPPAYFEHMTKLRVLDLSHTGITSLPSSLSIVESLKVLDLNNCKQLAELPSHLVKLVNLESLDIHVSGITNIPAHIQKLIFLKRLWVSFGNGSDFNYNVISRLHSLEELVIDMKSPLLLTIEVVENIMKEVAMLQNFKRLRVCFPNSMIVDVIEVAPTTVRIRVPEAGVLLSYITSRWGDIRSIGPFRFFIGCKDSEYSPNPKFLIYDKYFKYCNGDDSNTSILEVLAEAEAFELVNHKDIKQLSDFGTENVNKIKGCLIEGCNAVETIMDIVGSELLPNLEQLFVKNLPMLRSIWTEGSLQPRSLTKLTTLSLCGCQIQGHVFPLGVIHQLREIQYLTIEKCDEVEEIIAEAYAIGNLEVLPNLEELILLDMTKLRSICGIEPLDWPLFGKLEIFNCPSLCRLPFNKGNTANLKHIEAEREWWNALQWQNPEDGEGLEKFCNFRSRNGAAL